MTRRMEEMRRGGEAGGQVWWIQEQIGWLVGWFIPEEHAERVVFQHTLLNKVYFRIWVQNFDPQILACKALGSKFGATCISYKFDHQMTLLALVANLPARWRHLH